MSCGGKSLARLQLNAPEDGRRYTGPPKKD
jgi:hypothetical protein